ncbi:MAG TPA: hypothetical protein DCK78_13125 [Paenibacillus lactis]|uniref:Uncharacterized protein n=3 Tax=Paenibacillus lactis TaxID=228574 RepID=G4HHG5_9BACL|nr:hypothetical protein PaelaDRAFT_3426 [Paenibacillus lactis 154]GIO89066.1 hypothetical protein J31TS3_02930 [Paenibacillus lactis]HAF99267.1 hypothetical protein [Paenibacillus lactis]
MPYYIWLVVSALLSLYGVITYWPNYSPDDEMVLFNDVATAIFFTPSFFILFLSMILQAAILGLKRYRAFRRVLYILIYPANVALFYVITMNLMPISTIIILVLAGSVVAVLHYFLSYLFKN